MTEETPPMAPDGAIRPALSAEQWKRRAIWWQEVGPGGTGQVCPSAEITLDGELEIGADWVNRNETIPACFTTPERIAGLMALANAALPDGDPRKLTWAMVDAIREELAAAAYHYNPSPRSSVLAATADAVAALLPPREP